MYKLLLVSDKEEIRSLYRHYAEWNTLGFEQPAIAENAQHFWKWYPWLQTINPVW